VRLHCGSEAISSAVAAMLRRCMSVGSSNRRRLFFSPVAICTDFSAFAVLGELFELQ
jgi:hypothetical protein